MSLEVQRIKGKNDNSWLTLDTPISLAGGIQIVDSAHAGRDATGTMHRDVVASKMKYTCTIPAGISNTQMVAIIAVLKQPFFYCKMPDIETGTFTQTRKFYTTAIEPQIHKINANGTWVYEEFEFNMTEI